jgi:hypothetical protein
MATLVLWMVGSIGCSTHLGNFTAASTHNVRNLQYSLANKTKVHVQGDTCIHSVLFIPFGHSGNRIEYATDDAIRDGQSRGLDGDLLVNVRMTQFSWSVLLYSQDCIKVEGDLVSLAAGRTSTGDASVDESNPARDVAAP